MTTVVPLTPVPAQKLAATLGGQSVDIVVYMMGDSLYFDLAYNGTPLVYAALCLDRVKLVNSAYSGFAGDLAFIDTQGTDDPTYDGLGSRYLLVYLP